MSLVNAVLAVSIEIFADPAESKCRMLLHCYGVCKTLVMFFFIHDVSSQRRVGIILAIVQMMKVTGFA